MAPNNSPIQAILLDIEGTTTPVDYVFGVLFPFARNRALDFLQTQGHTEAVRSDLELLRESYNQDLAKGEGIPDWSGNEPIAAVPYIHYLIQVDRKSTGLKSLQGKIWNQGYELGLLQSQLFADVKPALERWSTTGKRLYIYSSGSVQAQQLLFRHSEYGDLTPLLQGYFDTKVGSKRETESYGKIAQEIGLAPQHILFISDVVAELQAAQTAGIATLFSWRQGNHSADSQGFPLIENFDQVDEILEVP